MLLRRVWIVLFLLGFGGLVAIAIHFTGEKRRVPDDPAKEFSNFKPLANGISRTKQIALYEGLPHQHFQRALLEQELQTKKTLQLHEFPFYPEPLDLSDADALQLEKLILDKDSFREMRFNTKKACGGFHPDFAVEFSSRDELYHVLICCGCVEIKIYGPKNALYCDVRPTAHDKLVALLNPYHKYRPTKLDPPTEVPLLFEPSGN